jgi:membrane-associated HD superfamily phosphohydrolase
MDKGKLESFIQKIIHDKIMRSQFDNCNITLSDLNIVKNVLVGAIPSIHHKRVKYQNNNEVKV